MPRRHPGPSPALSGIFETPRRRGRMLTSAALALGLVVTTLAAGSAAFAAVPAPETDNTAYVVAADTTFTISGTGVAGEGIISVTSETEPGASCDNVPVGEDGRWSCDTTTAGMSGEYMMRINQTVGEETSEPIFVPLSVNGGGGGGGGEGEGEGEPAPEAAMDCSYQPGTVLLSTPGDSQFTVSLYAVSPPKGDEGDYTPQPGHCSGNSGTPYGTFDDGEAINTCELIPGESPCEFAGLTPGIWNLYYGYGETGNFDYFFTIPEAPTAMTAEVGGGNITFRGSAIAGNQVSVVDQESVPVCTGVAGSDGSWACAVEAQPASGYRSYQTDAVSYGASPYSEPAPLIIPPPLPETGPIAIPTPTPTPTPAPTVAPPKVPLSWTLTISGVNGPLKPGQKVTLSSRGLPPGSVVQAELHSTPMSLGTTTVRSDGTFSMVATIPKGVEPGDHHFVVTVTAPGDDPSTVENAVAIVPEDPEALIAPERVVADAPRLDDRQAELEEANPRNQEGAPTALTGSVPTLLEILTSPATIGIAAGVALIIMLLVALPTEVLNSTLSSNTSRFGRTFSRLERATNAATEWLTRVTRTPVVAATVLIVVGAIIFGFVDPGFGFDLASLRLVLSVGIALFIITVIASRITGLIVNRAWSVESALAMQPVGLVFAALGVIVARVLDFSPGFLIGLVIGLELSHRANAAQRTRATVVQFSVVVALALLAWVGYSVAVGLQGDAPATFVSGMIQDALAAVTAEGLTALTIALLPIGFLEGREIFERSKPLWVAMFLVVGTIFSLLVLPTAVQGSEVGNIAVWVIVLAGFAALTLGLWAWLRFTGPRESENEPEPEKVDAA